MGPENWRICNKKADFEGLMKHSGFSEIFVRLLVNRGISTPDLLNAYLNPDLSSLHDPFLLKDCRLACDILKKKLLQGKRIRIIGDYDVDGVVSTYILQNALEVLKAHVDYCIPDRIKDGYGINDNMIEEAFLDHVDTIITCDNGISAENQIAKAKELGMTVIITDHHEVSDHVPNADAIINPKQKECAYPYSNLCGAAVAAKFMDALFQLLDRPEKIFEDYIEFVAMATMCDVMELLDENRVIVKLGIGKLGKSKNWGLKALYRVNKIEMNALNSTDIGYVLGPCLNATGRLHTATLGVELLRSNSMKNAMQIASQLKILNGLRKTMTAAGVDEAIKQVEEKGACEDKVIVVYLPECHESIAGIIAGRLKERYNKPAIVFTNAEEGAKGSARSVEAYHIYNELTNCKDLLTKYGGHPMAAGLSLPVKNIEPLREMLNAHCVLTDEDLIPNILIDAVVPFGLLSKEVVREIQILEPYGNGNRKPLLAERDVKIVKMSKIGTAKKFRRFVLQNQFGRQITALYFGAGDIMEQELADFFGVSEVKKAYQGFVNKIVFSLTYYPDINEYMGQETLQIIICNYKIR